MANEGSTKPDYFALCDEHRAFYEKNSLPYATCARCLLAASEQKRYAAEAENLRVRGLLQRTMDCEKCDNCDEHFDELDELLLRVAAPDAGKLDAADKSVCECGDSFFFHKTVCLGINESGNCKCNNFRPAGSAETGGEKAVPILKNSEDDRVGGE